MKPQLRRVLRLEPLEGRCLLAALPTLTSLSVPASSAPIGQPVTLTATVIVAPPNTGTPNAGTVAFSDNGTALGSAPVSGGTATLTTSGFVQGVNVITGAYSGSSGVFLAGNSTLSPNSIISTAAGGGAALGDGGAGTAALLDYPSGVVCDAAGDIFIADSADNCVRELLAATGQIITVAGDDSAATAAVLQHPTGLALDGSGNLYIVETGDATVCKLNLATGVIKSVAGSGRGGVLGDGGPATIADLNGPSDVAVDSSGNLYIADTMDNRIRKVSAGGIITTVAGDGTEGFSGDGGAATAAQLSLPRGVAVDAAGDLFIADSGNNRVREVNAAGVITTVAGGGQGGDGSAATNVKLSSPEGVTLDAAGDIFIGDTSDNRVREVNASTRIITTLAGNGTAGFSGDGGPASAASLNFPAGVSLDSAGDVFVADPGNNRVRKIASGAATVDVAASTTLAFVAAPAGVYGGTVTLSATLQHGGAPLAGQAVFFTMMGTTVGRGVTNAAGLATVSGVNVNRVAPGTYTGVVSAVFGGSSAYLASSAATNLTVGAAPLTVTVNDASKPYGSPDPAFTANYDGLARGDSPADLTGTLSVATTEPASGFAPLGTYQLTGSGQSSADYAITYVAGTLTVTPTATTVTVGAVPGAVTYGQALTLTANVAAVAPSTATPTGGTVTFLDGSTTLGTAPLAAGSASLSGVVLAAGSHNVTAYYSGDGADFLSAGVAVTPASLVTTVAGGIGDGAPATEAARYCPVATAVDAAGDIFVADTNDNRIREVLAATGTITTIAGTGTAGFSGDGGPATAAELDQPQGLALDARGNLYVADESNNCVREINLATGVITTVAGTDGAGYGGDGGPATAALLTSPSAVAVDQAGDLFIADSGNCCIREVFAGSGLIATVAGNGQWGYNGDGGQATDAEMEAPDALALDSAGNLYVSDSNAYVVREIALSTNTISTVAGDGSIGYGGDGGPATAATFQQPSGVAVDGAGNLYIADAAASCVRMVAAGTGIITTIAGNGSVGSGGDGGQATAAQFENPSGLTIDAGNLLIADTNNWRIRSVNLATNVITTVVGTSTISYGGDGGQATSALLQNPGAVAVDSAGDLFIADSANNRVREVNHATGIITTVAGNGTSGFSGDGQAASAAELSDPSGVALDGSGDLFIADTGNNRIREVNLATGVITTIAGTGSAGFGGDGGPAATAPLDSPCGIAVDASGDLFIADAGSGHVREINSAGVISTVAGSGGIQLGGDGGPATLAALCDPVAVAIDAYGNLYIVDSAFDCVREVNVAGIITTVAGIGTSGYTGDGQSATAAELSGPAGVAVDAAGDVFVADSGNNRVREVAAGDGIISAVAGTGTTGFGGDGGAATAAALAGLAGLAVDAAGNLYVADAGNNRVRCVAVSGGSSLTVAPATLTVTAHNASRIYGAADPTYTATITGLVNGDSLGAVVTGTPGLTNSDSATSPAGTYTITAGPGTLKANANYTFAFASGTLTVYSAIAGRYLFYANSSYNGNSEAASAADDNAIDTGKTALLPGQTATYADYTDGTQGINGIMVDVAGLANPAGLTAADFQFLVGNDSNPGDWTTLTVTPTVTVRVGAGTGGSDRVEMIWPDNAIHNQWLQVTVLADANTGLATPDVFYFGSEPGAVTGNGYASFDDIFAVYRAIGNTPTVTASTVLDVNHDGMITFDDIFAVYRAIGGAQLNMITAPAAPAGSPAVTPAANPTISAMMDATAAVATTARDPTASAADTATPVAAPVANSATVAAAPPTAAIQPVAAVASKPRQAVIVPVPLETAARSATGEISVGLALPPTAPTPAASSIAPPPSVIPSRRVSPAGTSIVSAPSFAVSAAHWPLPLPWAAQSFLPFDLALAQTQHWSWTELSPDTWDDGEL